MGPAARVPGHRAAAASAVFQSHPRMAWGGRRPGHIEGFVGNGLLLHTVTHALPSALAGLTAGFEMVPGVPPPL